MDGAREPAERATRRLAEDVLLASRGRVVVPHDAAEAELLHLQDRERRLPRREADLRRLAAAPRRLRPQLHRRRDDAAGAAGVQVQWLPSFAEVYKPPAAEWTAPAERWQLEFGEKVTDLGGYSVFLGRGEGFAVHAQDFPLIRGNCVYYARNDILYSLMSCREFHVLRNIMRGKELAAAGPILGCVSRGPSSLPQGVVSSDEDYFLNNSIASTVFTEKRKTELHQLLSSQINSHVGTLDFVSCDTNQAKFWMIETYSTFLFEKRNILSIKSRKNKLASCGCRN